MISFRANSRLQRLGLSVIAAAVVLGAFWCARQFQKSNTSANPWNGSKRAPYERTEDDPISALAGSVDLVGASDFALAIGSGHRPGTSAIRISADGRCRIIYLETVQVTMSDGRTRLEDRWRGRDFEVGPQMLADLRKLLVEIDLFRMKRVYHANVIDGGHSWVMVQASGKQKRVYCINYAPEPFGKLIEFIFRDVLERRAEELETVPLIDIDIEKEELVAMWRQFHAYVHTSP